MAVLSLILLAACGHTIRPEFAPNYFPQGASQGGFDFARPPCRVSPPPELAADEVGIRYLGAGGLYVEWRGTALLMAPYFSNPSIWQYPLGHLTTDPAAVARGLDGMDLSRVRAIVAGHSHYDHLGDLPLIAETYAPGARVYVNESGARALAAVPALAGRVASLQGEEGAGWIGLRDAEGNPLPIRFRKVESAHAPHFWGVHLGRGEIPEKWRGPWESHRLRELREGRVFAFVIELLSPDSHEPRFRLYYQDAASPPGTGIPRLEEDEGHAPEYDLAVLCMASFYFVRHQPKTILGALQPRHVLVTHYEDFFRDTGKPIRFVLLLPDLMANRFFLRMRRAWKERWPAVGPEAVVCGPSSQRWTMPLPGEWVRFRVQ